MTGARVSELSRISIEMIQNNKYSYTPLKQREEDESLRRFKLPDPDLLIIREVMKECPLKEGSILGSRTDLAF